MRSGGNVRDVISWVVVAGCVREFSVCPGERGGEMRE